MALLRRGKKKQKRQTIYKPLPPTIVKPLPLDKIKRKAEEKSARKRPDKQTISEEERMKRVAEFQRFAMKRRAEFQTFATDTLKAGKFYRSSGVPKAEKRLIWDPTILKKLQKESRLYPKGAELMGEIYGKETANGTVVTGFRIFPKKYAEEITYKFRKFVDSGEYEKEKKGDAVGWIHQHADFMLSKGQIPPKLERFYNKGVIPRIQTPSRQDIASAPHDTNLQGRGFVVMLRPLRELSGAPMTTYYGDALADNVIKGIKRKSVPKPKIVAEEMRKKQIPVRERPYTDSLRDEIKWEAAKRGEKTPKLTGRETTSELLKTLQSMRKVPLKVGKKKT